MVGLSYVVLELVVFIVVSWKAELHVSNICQN